MKYCPNCGKPLPTEKVTACPHCKVLLLDQPELHNDRSISREEGEFIAKNVSSILFANSKFKWGVSWRAALMLLGFIAILTGWGIIGYFQAITNVQQNLEILASNKLAELNLKLISNINGQFEEPRIRQTVSNVAAIYATNLMRKEIEPGVIKFNEALSNKLEAYAVAFTAFQTQAKTNLDDLQASIKIGILISAANNDDRSAFFELVKIRDDSNSQYRYLAARAITQITGQLNMDQIVRGFIHVDPWQGTTNNSPKATFEEFLARYSSQSPIVQVYLINQLFSQERFAVNQRLTFVLAILKSSPSIKCVAEACHVLEGQSKTNLNILGLPHYIEWCEKQLNSVNKKTEDKKAS